ncbi:MAG: phosphopentomutase [Myxococcales bacterium]|nr:phosphopentomutase [Myxococcales bacterium]
MARRKTTTPVKGENRRVVVIVLDSAGIGELPDAGAYGDGGAATLPNLARAVGGLTLPHLAALGLGRIAPIAGVSVAARPEGWFGKMAERSPGKDTTTGHWELMGLVLAEPFATFPKGFPEEIVREFSRRTGRGVLGNKAASGTAIIDELGREHQRTGQWIVYTSADSVFQVAAHEETIPLEELYRACRAAREFLDAYRVGRVIARPFVGAPGAYRRTYHRHDFSMKPTGPTVLDALRQAGVPVWGVGKIGDIFAGQGVERSEPTEGNASGIEKTLKLLDELSRGLLFVNLVDFDMTFGHRRDAAGYARALVDFDAALPRIQERLRPGDLLLITADHGCDPTFAAHTDHTREYVPLVAWRPRGGGGELGVRRSFADLGATVAEALGVPWAGPGESFFPALAADAEAKS